MPLHNILSGHSQIVIFHCVGIQSKIIGNNFKLNVHFFTIIIRNQEAFLNEIKSLIFRIEDTFTCQSTASCNFSLRRLLSTTIFPGFNPIIALPKMFMWWEVMRSYKNVTNFIFSGQGPEQGVRRAGEQTAGQAGLRRALTSLSLDTQTRVTSPGPGGARRTPGLAAYNHWNLFESV